MLTVSGGSDRRGFVLLDALVALAATSITVVALAETASGALRVAGRLAAREDEMLRADRVLAAVALLTAEDLDRRLGERHVAGLRVAVQRPEPEWYTIAVSDTEGAELIAGAVYRRPEITR